MKKNYTFIIASDHKTGTKKFVIPAAWMKLGISLVFVFSVLGATAFVDYVGLLFQSVENKRLKAENLQLKNQFTVVKNKLDELESGLERINVYTTKLRLITGPQDESNIMRLAMGPIPNSGQAIHELNENMESRQPASLLGVNDSVFFQKAPLEQEHGEVFEKQKMNYASIAVRIDKLAKEATLKEQNITELWETLGNRKSLLHATPALRPTNGWFTSRFGYRKSPFSGRLMMHNGIDIAAPYGAPIYAAADGIVSYAGFESGYGKLVTIDHGYGVKTRYGHSSAILAQVGQKIKRGDVIAKIGDTGRATAPHVHYEVRVNGIPVDPANYILNE